MNAPEEVTKEESKSNESSLADLSPDEEQTDSTKGGVKHVQVQSLSTGMSNPT